MYFRQNLTLCFAYAGDGCFYVGLGGKGSFPKSPFEPYQCCPSKPSRGTKVAKATHPKMTKQVTAKPSPKPKPKPVIPVKPAPQKETKKEPAPKAFAKVTKADKNPKEAGKGKDVPALAKAEKGKGKKGFFGTGKYVWWW